MDLLEIISIVSDSTESVIVRGCDGNILSCYDGRNSIDIEHNEMEVFYIEVKNNSLILWVLD